MNVVWRTVCLLLLLAPASAARDAAFMEPGTASGKANSSEALVADPKIFEAGESTVGISRRVSLFFVNATALAARIPKKKVMMMDTHAVRSEIKIGDNSI